MKIPSRSVFSVFGLLLLSYLSWILWNSISLGFKEIFALREDSVQIWDITRLVWVPVSTFTLIASMVCLTLNIFMKLKNYREVGLISSLFICLRGSIVVSLFWGTFIGICTGLDSGMAEGLKVGSLWGFIVFMIVVLLLTPLFCISFGIPCEIKRGRS
jgi:hypothetical protein